MKKIINHTDQYTDDMLKGIYAVHQDKVKYVANDLRCYCTRQKLPGKVAIVTGGGNGHLPLFLGYVGDGMLDGCGVGDVFQSPSGKQIYQITKEVESGAGVLYLYGNYTGDIMIFEDAAERCAMAGIETRSIVGTDDVNSSMDVNVRRGVAGIFFMYKAAGAKARAMGSLDEVFRAAQKAKDNTRTVGFALSPCIIPEKGVPNFTLAEDEMSMGMGIHGEPGIWNGPLKTADEIARESLDTILKDMPCRPETEVALLINGLGSTPLDELYILANNAISYLNNKNIRVYRSWIGEFATSMEMAGASISLCRVDSELKSWFDEPVCTPFYTQN
ncbi:dihydroxyacetone kinase subunit DhaK [Necropsobacter rosorum]|uniref:dihydroxyacetone kinase subunit DhaK n=1 Tax=Necropsobacter rosorum TaxID=908285 RepID=UPI0005094E7B